MKLVHVAILLTCFVNIASSEDRPNILLFTADDLHAESLGVYGGRPADFTPNLDAVAAESLQFNKAHVNVAICAPCRAVIATGRYSHRSGAMGSCPPGKVFLPSNAWTATARSAFHHTTRTPSLKLSNGFVTDGHILQVEVT